MLFLNFIKRALNLFSVSVLKSQLIRVDESAVNQRKITRIQVLRVPPLLPDYDCFDAR